MSATHFVDAPRAQVFDYLLDLENHWQLADRFIEVLELERSPGRSPEGLVHGGRVRMHGPLGMRRTATTRVLTTDPQHSISGTAELAGGTRARVMWRLWDDRGGTQVELSAELERAGALDRLLLALGGRRWLRGHFASTLETLGRRFAP
jgi:Polyketide cyclase / dehydrase and lipid transport